MKIARLLSVVAVVVAALAIFPVQAQDAPPVIILPIDDAQFLPGAMFDFRIEVHAEAMPENLSITVNGTPAAELFGAEGVAETWVFGAAEDGTGGVTSQSLVWRDLTAPAAGEYVVEVTAGATVKSVTWTVRPVQVGTAKNVILFVADGMTFAQISAARIASKGITAGVINDHFAMEQLAEIGIVQTGSVDSIMADSANTASAVNTGHVGWVNATGSYADTSPDRLDDPKVETLASMLKRTRGMSIGSISTADFTDATPAAVWAHGRDRSAANRAAFALQALESEVDVLMGGGGRYMLPQSVEGSARRDDIDVFAEYEAAGYTVVTTKTEMMAVTDASKVLGIFHQGDLNVWLDRNVYTENAAAFPDQPGLVDMTLASLNILNTNPNGFFLAVEAGSVDKQMHPLDQERALSDLIEFDKAVEATIAWASENAPDTLIVVTADHGHGYDVYGTVDVEAFNAATTDAERRNAIGVYQAAGYPTYTDPDGDGYPDWNATITFAGAVNNNPDYTENYQVSETPRQPATSGEDGVAVDNPDDDANGIVQSGNLPMNSTTGVHTLQDVPVFAGGPGAEFFGRALSQRELFFGMAYALGLDLTAEDGMAK